MKKLISMLIICVMLISAMAVSGSAAVIYKDEFTSFNTSFWSEYTQFAVTGGCAEAWEDAIVLQSWYDRDEAGIAFGAGTYNHFTAQVEVRVEEATDAAAHAVGLWIEDMTLVVLGEAVNKTTYSFMYCADNSTVSLLRDTTNPLDEDTTKILAVYEVPGVPGYNISGDPIKLGIKVEQGKISGYLDGKEVASYSSPTIGTHPTPILLWNSSCHALFDNFILGDLAELPVAAPVDTTVPGDTDTSAPSGGENTTTTTTAPVTSLVTKVEEGTDEEGNVTTKIVSEVVTVAPADTNTGGTAGGNGANTGDMAFIVVAVMIVALGCAVVVKKVNVK